MKPVSFFFFFFILSILYTIDMQACSCERLTIAESFETSDVIVYGTVIDIEMVYYKRSLPYFIEDYYENDRDSNSSKWYLFKVDLIVKESYKGLITNNKISVYTNLHDSSCGYPFKKGEEYIVHGNDLGYDIQLFFHKNHNPLELDYLNSVVTGLCTKTTSLVDKQNKKIVEYLKQL